MAVWKRICCPVDGSVPSSLALVEAAELTHRLEGELTVLRVIDHRPGETTFVAPPELHREEEARAGRDLDRWVEEAVRRAPGRVRGEMLHGPPAERILAFLREGRFDLVAMGTHGRKGLKRLMLGSVAEKVVREAPCSVLVVRAEHLDSEPD
jgi:nucleotide-binding universal stress UspA family protein